MTSSPQQLTLPCLRWRDRGSSYAPKREPLDPSRYGVELIAQKEAKAFVTRHHYSGTYPAARLRCGLFQAGVGLVGVAVFGVPMSQAVIPKWCGVEPNQGVELSRFVLLDEVPANAETWFLARCFKLLKVHKPEVRAVLSFSDPVPRYGVKGEVVLPGHVGTIYQAHNGLYLGRSAKKVLSLAPDGRVITDRTLSKIRGGEVGERYASEQLVQMGCPPRDKGESGASYVERAKRHLRRIKHPGNHSYLWAIKGRVMSPHSPRPYPKQVESSTGRTQGGRA